MRWLGFLLVVGIGFCWSGGGKKCWSGPGFLGLFFVLRILVGLRGFERWFGWWIASWGVLMFLFMRPGGMGGLRLRAGVLIRLRLLLMSGGLIFVVIR